jgi:hypothetical protein
MCDGSGCCPRCAVEVMTLRRGVELLRQRNAIEQHTAEKYKTTALDLVAELRYVRDRLAASGGGTTE